MRRRDFEKLVPEGWTVEEYRVRGRPENLDHTDAIVTVYRDDCSDVRLGLWADTDGELEWFLYDEDGLVEDFEGPKAWTVDDALQIIGDVVKLAEALEKEYVVVFIKTEYVKAYGPEVAIKNARRLYLDDGYREADASAEPVRSRYIVTAPAGG